MFLVHMSRIRSLVIVRERLGENTVWKDSRYAHKPLPFIAELQWMEKGERKEVFIKVKWFVVMDMVDIKHTVGGRFSHSAQKLYSNKDSSERNSNIIEYEDDNHCKMAVDGT